MPGPFSPPSKRRNRAFPRRLLLLILLVFTLSLLADRWFKRNQPNRLIELTPDSVLYSIRNGRAILSEPDSKSGYRVFRARPVAGGTDSEIGREYVLDKYMGQPVITDGELVYTWSQVQPWPKRRDYNIRPIPAHVRQMSLGKGDFREATFQFIVPWSGKPLGGKAAIVGRTLFWIEPHSLSGNSIPWGDVEKTASAVRSAFLRAALDDGNTHVVLTGLPGLGPNLVSGKDAVYWAPSMLMSGQCFDLSYYTTPNGKLGILHHYDGQYPPVEYNGRLYWIQYAHNNGAIRPATAVGGTSTNTSLVSSNMDGTDLRILLRLKAGTTTLFQLGGLKAYRGRLYGLAARSRDGKALIQDAPRDLIRVQPNDSSVLESLFTLPRFSEGDGFFDGGYYYMVVKERHESWLDWSKEGLVPKRVRALYRYKLPK